MSGWIKLHRSILDHWIYESKDPFSKREAWVDILLQVNYTPKKVNIGGDLFECGIGESVNSLDTWAKRWGWNKSKVRRFLKLLESDSMVVTKSIQKTTHLTVVNYETYQDVRNADETQMKRKRNADETQMTPTKEGKKERRKEIKEYTSDFEGFWEVYGRKGNKAKAFACWTKLNSDDIEIIRQRLPAYLYKTRNDLAYRKDAQTYLNPTARHFEDVVYISEKQEANQDDIF